MAIKKKQNITSIIGRIMKPIATTLATTYATKSEVSNAIDDLANKAVVKDMPVSVENDTLVFEATAEAGIDGEMLIIGEE